MIFFSLFFSFHLHHGFAAWCSWVDLAMDFEEEEIEGVYYRENEDILKLIDELREDTALGFKKGESHAVIPELRDMPLPREDGYIDNFEESRLSEDRPFSKAYLSDQVKRLRILEQNSDFRWAQYMAGAMGREVHEVYREDDLERVLLERERMREIMKADIKRTIIPLKEKQDQLLLLQNEKRRLLGELEEIDLTTIGDLRARSDVFMDGSDGFIGFIKLEKIYQFIKNLTSRERPTVEISEETRKKNKEYVRKHIDRDAKDDISLAEEELMTISFEAKPERINNLAVEVLHMNKYLFDATSKTCIVRLARNTIDPLLRLLPKVDQRESSNILDPLDLELFGENRLKKDQDFWISLEGYEIAYMPYVLNVYHEKVVSKMIRKGLNEYKEHWGSSVNYPELMTQFITTGTFDLNAIGKFNFFRDQPESIKKCLFQVFGKIPDFFGDGMDEGEQKIKLSRLLRGHYLWKYFHESSALVLAYHWKLSDDAERYQVFVHFNHLFYILIQKYQFIFVKLYNKFILPVMREMRGPNQTLLFDLSKYLAMDDRPFGAWNLILQNQIDYELIRDPDFRSYFINGKSFFITLTDDDIPLKIVKKNEKLLNQNPVLKLHFLFTKATQYLERYKYYLANKLRETEKSISDTKELMAKIASERNPMNGSTSISGRAPYTQNRQFVTKAINSGLISLKPEITHFMAVAHTKIQQYCPGLEGLPLEEFQADHANLCGLENDFAAFVAALIAKNGNIYQRSYKSKHHERAILTNDTETMHALKYYRFSLERWSSVYKTWRESVPLTVAREERRVIQVKRRLIL